MREFGKVFKYKNHFIAVTKKRKDYYTASYTVNDQEYHSGNSDLDKILKYFRSNVDKLTERDMKDKTHEEVYKEWVDKREKKVTYKNKTIYVRVLPHPKEKNGRAFYIGTYYPYKVNGKLSLSSTIESIHYDKVVSRFQRFVDEYCTDWREYAQSQYKSYYINIDRERDKEFYIGTVQFHKNSTFKHIADTREEVERCCKNRIDKVIYEKEKVQRKMLTPKQEKIQELEQLQARISTQLEELKKEKDTLTYKGVILECEQGKNDTWIFVGKIKNAPENIGVRTICGDTLDEIQRDLEEYVDWLEIQYNLYCKITGKE